MNIDDLLTEDFMSFNIEQQQDVYDFIEDMRHENAYDHTHYVMREDYGT